MIFDLEPPVKLVRARLLAM